MILEIRGEDVYCMRGTLGEINMLEDALIELGYKGFIKGIFPTKFLDGVLESYEGEIVLTDTDLEC